MRSKNCFFFVNAQATVVISHFLVVIEVTSRDENAVGGSHDGGELVVKGLTRHGVVEVHQ